MELLVDGVSPLSKSHNSVSGIGSCNSSAARTSRPPHPPSTKLYSLEGDACTSYATAMNHGTNATCSTIGSVISSKHSYRTIDDPTHCRSSKGKMELVINQTEEVDFQKQVAKLDIKSGVHDSNDCNPRDLLGPSNSDSSIRQLDSHHLTSQSGMGFCPSPQNSLYSATHYTEAKQSFTNTELSECESSVDKSVESGEVSNSVDLVESRKTSMYRGSSGSDFSDESSTSSLASAMYKPHQANDTRWEAIQAIRSREGKLGLNNFRLSRKLGRGDIGSVYLSELAGTRTYFAMKVMDKTLLANRKKLLRAQTEREILQSLDHPFLPTLYTHFETETFSCLVMEFCPGGDLHALRQRQPGKYFPEHAARFYVAEVLLALEYLHMLGIIYRDLKPENVLVREDGHIMLSDFDLSLRCAVSPTLVRSSNSSSESKNSAYCSQPSCVIQPSCIQPACFAPRFLNKPKKEKKIRLKSDLYNQMNNPLPELIAEPTSARSMSFVGTHEYLAPEIIKGEGHGSAVDWWTFGIFLYELLFGRTPFKGQENRATLFNVVGQPLRFPESPSVSFAARDLIRGLLVKEPQHRLAYRRGATEIKQHPFFQSVNWALIRCANPPDVPKPFVMDHMSPTNNNNNYNNNNYAETAAGATIETSGVNLKPSGNYLEIDFF